MLDLFRPFVWSVVLVVATANCPTHGAPPAEGSATKGEKPDAALSREVAQLVVALESEDFAARKTALARLKELAKDEGRSRWLAGEVRRVLMRADVSLETSAKLEQLLGQLPTGRSETAAASSAQVVRLIGELTADVYSVRSSAHRRLSELASHPPYGSQILVELERRLDDPRLAVVVRAQLEPLWNEVRAAWITGEPKRWQLPDVSDAQIEHWLDALAREGAEDAIVRQRHELAHRKLLDMLAREEVRPRLLQKLTARLAEKLDRPAAQRLERVRDWSRPAMVAEIWRNYQQVTAQHLLVGVPQYPDAPQAQKATHFDFIDNKKAHCVSGNTLAAGDYPVGIAIAPPQGYPMIIHLVNLPTPRDRLAYECELRLSEADRLRRMSQRTLDDILERKHRLTETELPILRQLDRTAVSRFASAYFEKVLDATQLMEEGHGIKPPDHVLVCDILADVGTRDAMPALEALGRAAQVSLSVGGATYNIGWVAALAIAQREEWPAKDQWLAELVRDNTPLATDLEAPVELGATAAGILLRRHQHSVRPWGLIMTDETLLVRFGVSGYRFTSAESRDKVIAWWDARKARVASRPVP